MKKDPRSKKYDCFCTVIVIVIVIIRCDDSYGNLANGDEC